MDSFEKEAFSGGYCLVAGVDEAGRGPLAGPVVAASAVFSQDLPTGRGIDDSKKLTESRRKALVYEIFKRAVSVGVGIVWPDEIDEINIHNASLLAMERSVEALCVKPEFLLIDGSFPIRSRILQRPVISGDSLSVSIAAASIIAKTSRDAIMESYGAMYPGYGLEVNKGYPTKGHREAIRVLGPTPIHRRSFRLLP